MTQQGNGNNSDGGRKREPVVRSISPGYVGELGNMVFQNPTPMGNGRAFMSPQPVADTRYEGGSQGKHQ